MTFASMRAILRVDASVDGFLIYWLAGGVTDQVDDDYAKSRVF